jgi:hypothetical protein
MKVKGLLVLLIVVVMVTGCEEFNTVRYPCQQYENWNTADCTLPKCKIFDYCTEDLFPSDVWQEIQDSLNPTPNPTPNTESEVLP